MDITDINLLRTQSVLSQEEVILLGRARIFSFVALGIITLLGFFVGGAYLAARLQYNQLESKRTTLTQSLTAQAKKQILLLSIQDRIPIIQKALESQYPWDKVVENVVAIVAPPFLKSIAIGENNVLNINAQTHSLEDIEAIIKEALVQTGDKKIRSPQISSMQINKDGTIDITLTVIPIL